MKQYKSWRQLVCDNKKSEMLLDVFAGHQAQNRAQVSMMHGVKKGHYSTGKKQELLIAIKSIN